MSLSNGLPRLTVAGNRIVNSETLKPVLLRGVNRSGFEYCRETQIELDEINLITRDWNANIIRLPFNQDWALQREGYDPAPYRQALANVIEMAAACGAYTLLDLQWLDAVTPRGAVDGKPNYVAPLPNLDSITLWRQLARLWRNETAVLYDIFNEPHDRLEDDPEPMFAFADDSSPRRLTSNRVRSADWHAWVRQLVSAIRSENHDALIFVSGLEWGYSLRHCPIPDLSGLVYSTHVYRWKGEDWDRAFGDVSEFAPVFAAEWGGNDADMAWGRKLACYLNDRAIGWTAWSWSDEPRLIAKATAPPYTPTKFGSLVRELMRSPADARD